MTEKMNNSPRYRRPDRVMLRRGTVLACICGVLMFVVLLARLYSVQIIDHDFYLERAVGQQMRQTTATAERGTIYDRNMNVLAVSADVENCYLSPAEIAEYGEDRELIAEKLSELLGLDYDDILKKTEDTGSWYVTVKRSLEREEADRVRAFKTEYGIKGVRLEPDSKRYYPNSSLACHVIGFVGTDGDGLEGIEAGYNEALAGTSGTTARATNAYGTDLLFTGFEDYYPGEDGCDLITTLDSAIQYYIEKHLNQAVIDYDIQNGAGAIAMDVNTGGILAMASVGGYDLNNFLNVGEDVQEMIDSAPESRRGELLAAAQRRQWRNKALSDTYEPGSTFKIITLSMALEEGRVSLNDSFYCPGSVSVIGRTSPIRCWKTQGHGSQTLTQAVQHSCNAAFVNIGLRVGAEKFYEYMDAFGFLSLTGNMDDNLSSRTGIDLSGESGSIFWSENTFYNPKNQSQLAAASFGQTFTITPLQLITGVSACVNGGYLMQPYVVQSVAASDGSVSYERSPKIVRQVISEETSETVRDILEQVVGDSKEGTGRNAAVAGYRIGGKTGTSEKVSLEATTGQKEYIVSFVGFAPADDPQIAILVFLDTPSSKSGIYISGGQMAAPVVGKMFADILPYLGVPRDMDEAGTIMPQVVGMDLNEAARELENASLRYRTIGNGDKITDQLPAAGTAVADNTQVIVYLEATPSEEKELIPDLTGMTLQEARDLLSGRGLYISSISPPQGGDKQIIGSQSYAPGGLAEHGSVIRVNLVTTDTSLLGRY